MVVCAKADDCHWILGSIPLDCSEIPQDRLNIELKARSNLFPWNGQFSPQFVEAILERYAGPKMKVLDPFAGSGTVLHECARNGLDATGVEINPAAYVLSKTYTLCNMKAHEREDVIAAVDAEINRFVYGIAFPMTQDRESIAAFAADFVAQFQYSNESEYTLFESLIILSDIYKGFDAVKLRNAWTKLRNIARNLPYSSESVRVILGDGRCPPTDCVFDLVITSPPYINVYNYHQQYRLSAEALGWDILKAAQAEIGSNRKNRGNRFLTAVQYCLDLAMLLENIWDATTADARLIFVLGRESRIRGVPLLNGEIFARLAMDAVGYHIPLKQERVFMNRFGQHIYEDIIHLEKCAKRKNIESDARGIAKGVLQSAHKTCDHSIGEDIGRAIEAADTLEPSQMFDAIGSHPKKTERTAHVIPHTPFRKTCGHAEQRQIAFV
jgi:16S rRNA G966 N2-methylase RsmD